MDIINNRNSIVYCAMALLFLMVGCDSIPTAILNISQVPPPIAPDKTETIPPLVPIVTQTVQSAVPIEVPRRNSSVDGSYLNVPIAIGIYSEIDVEVFNKYASEQDLIATRSQYIRYLDKVKIGNKMLVLSPRDEPLENFNALISQAIPYGISSLGYNLETALPDAELVRKEKDVADLARSESLLFAFAPTLNKLTKNYEDFAQYADVIVLQAQRYQSRGDFETQVEDLIDKIKTSNPKAKVWVQVSVNPPESRDIEAQIVIQQIFSVADKADLIWIFFAPKNASVLEEVLKGLRHSETSGIDPYVIFYSRDARSPTRMRSQTKGHIGS